MKVLLNAMNNTSESWLSILDTTKVVNEVLVGLTVAIAGWIIYLTWKWNKNKKAKRRNLTILLLEIEVNQKLLKPLSDSVAKALDGVVECSEEDKLPNELTFERGIYSALTDKLNLLDGATVNKLVEYYSDINHIEKEYNKLELFHGMSYIFLILIEFDEKIGRRFNNDNSPTFDEMDEFLRRAKKVYDLGEELVICLKE